MFTVKITLPRTIDLTVCTCDKRTALRAAEEFVVTAFANALDFWGDREPITDDEGRLLGEVRLEMANEGEIVLAADAIEITAREEARQ